VNRLTSIQHQFVEYIPDSLSEGKIYVSIDYATAAHKCCCCCGNEVITPISPTDWQLTFDGQSISLYPSIGNWGFDCRSHYWIRRNRVEWASQWSQERIKRGRDSDQLAKERYFGTKTNNLEAAVGEPPRPKPKRGPRAKRKTSSKRVTPDAAGICDRYALAASCTRVASDRLFRCHDQGQQIEGRDQRLPR
jgi:Family of unknown function (DUF6527)